MATTPRAGDPFPHPSCSSRRQPPHLTYHTKQYLASNCRELCSFERHEATKPLGLMHSGWRFLIPLHLAWLAYLLQPIVKWTWLSGFSVYSGWHHCPLRPIKG